MQLHSHTLIFSEEVKRDFVYLDFISTVNKLLSNNTTIFL